MGDKQYQDQIQQVSRNAVKNVINNRNAQLQFKTNQTSARSIRRIESLARAQLSEAGIKAPL